MRDQRTFYVHRLRYDKDAAGTIRRREGYVRVRGATRAAREYDTWTEAGWSCATLRSTPDLRVVVRAWERACKGYPGETVSRVR